jgi:hypothetical protein
MLTPPGRFVRLRLSLYGFECPLEVGIELVQPSGERVVDRQLAFTDQVDDQCPASSVGF